MADSRGPYRCLYAALVEDRDFLELAPPARHVLLTLRVCPQNNLASLFRCHPAVLTTQTGYPPEVLRPALAALVAGRWIEIDGDAWAALDQPFLVRLRNGLRFDPHLRLTDKKHRKSVDSALMAYGSAPLVAKFRDYYQLGRPFEDLAQVGAPNPIPNPNPNPNPSPIPIPIPIPNPSPNPNPSPGETTRDARSTDQPEGVSHQWLRQNGRTGLSRISDDPALRDLAQRRDEIRREKGLD